MHGGGRSRLLVEGWTGINHSYAMVNQYQLLAFLKAGQIDVVHREAPYFNANWSKDKVGAGFPAADAALLANIPQHHGEAVSAVYRIHSPASLAPATIAGQEVPVITFLVTEFGLDANCFTSGADLAAYVADGNKVVTPSAWSRQRMLDYGFPERSVYVVPHGVDDQRFYPMTAEERNAARAALGYQPDEVVLLNVGAPIWNKGLDLVLESFIRARQQHKNLRLLVKDQQALYGMTAVKMLQDMVAQGRLRVTEDDLAAIRVIGQSLSVAQLRGLYGVADYYLSPYRAEGFNLPVIESIACGTPVLVSAGGSTDDFCDRNTALRIPTSLATNLVMGDQTLAACLMPDMDALNALLGQCASGEVHLRERMRFGRADLLSRFPWRRATDLLTALL